MLSGLKAIGAVWDSSMWSPEFEGTYDRSRYVSNYQSNHDIDFVYGGIWKVLKTTFSIGKYSFIKQKLFTKRVCFSKSSNLSF